MDFCLVCYKEEDPQNLVLSCKCCVCQSCASQWFFTRIKERKFDRKVKCPNVQCPIQMEYEYEDLCEFEQANEQMVVNYCQISKDISYCPHCNYKGFYDISGVQSGCIDNFVCLQCNKQWSLTSSSRQPLTEIRTYFLKFFSTSTCPKCCVNIQKVGGCPEMTCKSCNYRFCWNCKQELEDHNFKFCFLSTLTTTIMQTLPIFFILFIFGLHQMIYQQLFSALKFESFQELLTKTLDFIFRCALYHVPIPLLAISFDNYQMIFTFPKLILTWTILILIILSFIQVEEFISIFVIEGFSLFFMAKFY